MVSVDYLLLFDICNELLELIDFYGWLVFNALSIFIYVISTIMLDHLHNVVTTLTRLAL